jgi:hypothetical protein
MDKNTQKYYEKFAAFERDYIAQNTNDLTQNYLILDEMYEQAQAMGHFTKADIWLGFESTLEVAKIINLGPHVSETHQ